MREMTEYELDLLTGGLCPMCGEKHEAYQSGPGGGAARNIRTMCGVWINIGDPKTVWPPLRFGQVLDDHVPLVAPPRVGWLQRLFQRFGVAR